MVGKVDDRSVMAKSMAKVSELMAISLMMIVPALIGIWIDRMLSTVMLFTILGLVFGMIGAGYQLVALVSQSSNKQKSAAKNDKQESTGSSSDEN